MINPLMLLTSPLRAYSSKFHKHRVKSCGDVRTDEGVNPNKSVYRPEHNMDEADDNAG